MSFNPAVSNFVISKLFLIPFLIIHPQLPAFVLGISGLIPTLYNSASSRYQDQDLFLTLLFFLFVRLFFNLGIYTSYKTFLHKDKTLIKRLLKVSSCCSVLHPLCYDGQTALTAWLRQTKLSTRNRLFTVCNDLVKYTWTCLSCWF